MSATTAAGPAGSGSTSAPSPTSTSTRTTRPGRRWLPTRAALVDHLLLLVLAAVALSALSTTFTGVSFLVVGLVGVLVGVVLAHVTAVLRWPAMAAVVLAVVVFVLLGGPLCLRSEGAGAFLPGPETLTSLGDRVVLGWKELLTTLPPVDGTGPLLVLPWTLGLVAGVLGGLLARRPDGSRAAARGAAGPGPDRLLAAVILLGVARPQSLWLQGVVFAVLALGWLAVRDQRAGAPVSGGAGRARRVAVPPRWCCSPAPLALPVTTWATGDATPTGWCCATYVEPPFDIGQYPSPLASFRRYVKTAEAGPTVNLYDRTLLTVDGRPGGRPAADRRPRLLRRHGLGRRQGHDARQHPDTFQRVSSTIDNPVDG